jgi:hypothetical protein
VKKILFILSVILILLFILVVPVAAQAVGNPPALASPPVTPELIAAVAGVVLSLLFSYVPGLNAKFAALDPVYKRLIMLLLLLITAAGIYGLNCGGVIQTGLACGREGISQIVWYFILSSIANQTSYQLSPPTQGVIAAKAGPTK